jgi:hypothetical protein
VPWLPRLLFRFTVLLATVLLGLVCLAPLADPGVPRPRGGARVLALFARDPFLRRTTVASTLGLYVTAWVFFRPGARLGASRRPKPPPPPVTIVGA